MVPSPLKLTFDFLLLLFLAIIGNFLGDFGDFLILGKLWQRINVGHDFVLFQFFCLSGVEIHSLPARRHDHSHSAHPLAKRLS